MRIIFHDLLQYSDAPDSLKSPALADTTSFTSLRVNFPTRIEFDSFGIGNTEAATINVTAYATGVESFDVDLPEVDKNGLYKLSKTVEADYIIFTFPSNTEVGRIAVGIGRQLGAAPAREPGFWTNITSRVTPSGQVIPGLGGVSGRHITADFRYKIDRTIYTDIQTAYPTQIARLFPLFISFTDCNEQNRFPFERFYGYTDPSILLQSSVNFFAYSNKFKFTEAF